MTTCAPWATIDDLNAPCSGDAFGIPDADKETALQMASDFLYNLTRRKYPGLCDDTVRPCTGSSRAGCGCGASPRACGCADLGAVELPGNPVVGVTAVKVDGVVVDPSEYRIDDGHFLTGLWKADDTRRTWGCCQDLSKPDTEEGTFSVAYTYGTDPPAGGVMAAASLACQLLLLTKPEAIKEGLVRFPKRVTTITRQGVTVAVLDPLTLFKDGQTGLPEVDIFVAQELLGDGRRSATVYDPSRSRSVTRTGP